VIPYVLHATAHTGSRELFRLAVLAIALGVAAGAALLFGVSLALGAFFAGMILSESELSHRAAQESLPLRDAFAVLFFVAVGMLFDPMIVINQPLPVLATLFIILFGKSVLAFIIVIAFRKPVSMALTISASLAQIGEFSFILAALGVSLGILPTEARDLILGGAILSIVLNPAMFWLTDRVAGWFGAATAHKAPDTTADPPEAVAETKPTALSNHTILIGYGRVGRVIAAGLKSRNVPFLVIEDAEGPVQAAVAEGIEVIPGNAAADALALANVPGAKSVMIAIPNAFEAAQATEQCRRLNPGIRIVARAHSDEEETYLGQLGANKVVMGEREIALGMLDWLDEAPPVST
jgi:monovalent cation:H+ antiporter-2, CPA2 family